MIIAENIISFFKGHPKFPFLKWYTDYNQYSAMYLCLTNLLKAYIPENQINDWTYAYNFIDFRRNPDGIVSFPLICINDKLKLVIYLGVHRIEDILDETRNLRDFSIQVSRDDCWGDLWEINAPVEDWYLV